jgi:hypothetical protein
MKFNSQICTTKIQSERLLALGLKKETADMCIRIDLANPIAIPYNEVDEFYYKVVIPAWSLHRLIEIYDKTHIFWTNCLDSHYEAMISCIADKIKRGELNKEYLEE